MRWFVAFALLAFALGVLGYVLAPGDVQLYAELGPLLLTLGVGAAVVLVGSGAWRARHG